MSFYPNWWRSLPDTCPDFFYAQQRAIAAVSKAKQTGQLPWLRGQVTCTDCPKPAQAYDHRDYSKPLDVQPVCHSCNFKRGRAKWVPIPQAVRYPKTPSNVA